MIANQGEPDDSGSVEPRLTPDIALPQRPSTTPQPVERERYTRVIRAAANSSAATVKGAADSSAEAVRRTTAQHNVLAVVALALVAFAPLTAGILAPVGAILGHLSLRQLKTRHQTGKGMARAAVTIGWTLTFIAPCIAFAALLGTFGTIIHMVTGLISLFG